jgi:hypothetical protein
LQVFKQNSKENKKEKRKKKKRKKRPRGSFSAQARKRPKAHLLLF